MRYSPASRATAQSAASARWKMISPIGAAILRLVAGLIERRRAAVNDPPRPVIVFRYRDDECSFVKTCSTVGHRTGSLCAYEGDERHRVCTCPLLPAAPPPEVSPDRDRHPGELGEHRRAAVVRRQLPLLAGVSEGLLVIGTLPSPRTPAGSTLCRLALVAALGDGGRGARRRSRARPRPRVVLTRPPEPAFNGADHRAGLCLGAAGAPRLGGSNEFKRWRRAGMSGSASSG